MVVVLPISFALGFFGSVPLAGPIAVLVFAYGVEGRFRAGISLSLGAALAESLYAYAAFWGVSTLLGRYPSIVLASHAVTGTLLIGVGIVLARRELSARLEKTSKPRHAQALALGFTISILNPTLLVTWSAATTALYGMGFMSKGAGASIPFAIGVIGGIVGWFSLLLLLIRRYSDRFTRNFLGRLINAMGVVLMLIGGWFLVDPIRDLVVL